MLSKMSAFNCNEVLPNGLRVESIDDFLYEIGLCHQSVSDRTKRSKIDSPKLIFAVLSFQLIGSMATLLTDDETTLLLLTDIGRPLNLKVLINPLLISITSMVIFNQLVYYWNHKRGIEPTFVRLFQVMSGSLSPSAVGLTDESQCRALLKIAKWLRPLHFLNKMFDPFITVIFIMVIYIPVYGWKGTFTYCSHILILNSIHTYYFFNIITSLLIYFIIICKYIVFKLNNLNSQLSQLSQSKSIDNNRIRNILHSYDALYREIDEYNTTYWSQFLFSVWLFFGIFIVLGLYLIFFTQINLILKILSLYVMINMVILYISIMTIASSLNSKANKSYKIMNTFIVNYRKHITKLGYRFFLINKLKVRF